MQSSVHAGYGRPGWWIIMEDDKKQLKYFRLLLSKYCRAANRPATGASNAKTCIEHSGNGRYDLLTAPKLYAEQETAPTLAKKSVTANRRDWSQGFL